jgi:hypothetical protein
VLQNYCGKVKVGIVSETAPGKEASMNKRRRGVRSVTAWEDANTLTRQIFRFALHCGELPRPLATLAKFLFNNT